MKKLIVLAVMTLSLAACGEKGNADIIGGNPATWEPALDSGQTSAVEIPNPFSECTSLEEAAENAGFSFSVPETVDGYAQRMIRTMADEEGSAMIEVIYQNEITDGSDETSDEIRMRKADGEEDISGDYTAYSESNSVTANNVQVTMRGENGKINLATWTDNGYTYSIGVYSGDGISVAEMSDLVAAIR